MDCDALLREAVSAARRSYQLRMTPGTSGNISVRIEYDPAVIMVSASKTSTGDLTVEQLVRYPEIPGTGRTPSIEADLHLGIYEVLPDIRSVLHYHGAWTVLAGETCSAGVWRPIIEMPELDAVAPAGEVPIVMRLPAGSPELAVETAAAARLGTGGLILRGHGGVAWGADPWQALFHAEALESLAKIDYLMRAASAKGGRSRC